MSTATPLADAVAARRADFPILKREVHGKPLAYLDHAASGQMAEVVIEAVSRYHRETHANVHRGVHTLSQEATIAYEGARAIVARFVKAPSAKAVVFTRGTTEAINLVAQSWGRKNLGPGDTILLTEMEHHANIVSWQLLAEAVGARIVASPMKDDGSLDLAAFQEHLKAKPKLVAFTHVSNALGTINPVADMVAWAKAAGATVLVDGAQAVPHLAVDVQAIGCDFYTFSGHKLGGPTGIGCLIGKLEVLESMPPWQGGGDMIRTVSFQGSTYNEVPTRFEAGTPAIAQAIGLGEAIRYLEGVGLDVAAQHEEALRAYAQEKLGALPGLRLIGTALPKAAVVSFVVQGIHPHDVGTLLDEQGIAIRAGHHCAQPLMTRLGLTATARASFHHTNTFEEVDRLVAAVRQAQVLFGVAEPQP